MSHLRTIFIGYLSVLATTVWRFMNVVLVCVLVSACESEDAKELKLGESTYKKVCKVCHAQGINGAPILGNKKMWAKRAPQGVEVLVDHAWNGYGLMPAKGGNKTISKEELSAAVKYMLSQVE